jgi:hypothetical protein
MLISIQCDKLFNNHFILENEKTNKQKKHFCAQRSLVKLQNSKTGGIKMANGQT